MPHLVVERVKEGKRLEGNGRYLLSWRVVDVERGERCGGATVNE